MNMKKLVALFAVALMVGMSTAAFADSSKIEPGKTKYKTYSITASPAYTVSLASNVSTGMRCKVSLSLNDLYNPRPDNNPNWKYSSSVTLVKDNANYTKTIKPGKSFKYVSNRSDKARLSFFAPKTNSSVIVIIYPR